jgi:hypothetical protein
MTAMNDDMPRRRMRDQLGRRRFLRGGLGAGALAAAATVFGSAQAAQATITKGCCHLCLSPSGTLSQCQTGTHYTWYCTATSGGLHCTCCERGNATGACTGVTPGPVQSSPGRCDRFVSLIE